MKYMDELVHTHTISYAHMIEKQSKLIELLNETIKPLVNTFDISIQDTLSKEEGEELNRLPFYAVNSKYRVQIKLRITLDESDPGYTVSIIWFPGVSYGDDQGLWEVMVWANQDREEHDSELLDEAEGYCNDNKVIRIIKQIIKERP